MDEKNKKLNWDQIQKLSIINLNFPVIGYKKQTGREGAEGKKQGPERLRIYRSKR